MISDATVIAILKAAPKLSPLELIELVVEECRIAQQWGTSATADPDYVAEQKSKTREMRRMLDRAEQAQKQEPDGCGYESCDCRGYCKKQGQQAEQEPVAIVVARQYEDGTFAGHSLEWAGRNEANDFPEGTEFYTFPPQQKQEPVVWNETRSKVIKALAAIVTVHTPDNLFDLDAIPREPVMHLVQQIKVAMYEYKPPQRQPLTDEECDRIYTALDEWAREFDQYAFGLPSCCGDGMVGGRAIIRAAHGIKGKA